MYHVQRLPRPARLAALCAALFTALPALATQGYFSHGYGMKATGMGGAALALTNDTMGGANNPASMVWVGTRLDLGAEVFRPYRDAERRGSALPTLNGRVESGRTAFLIPEFGYARPLRSDLSVGVSVYGNGGMNTSYPQGSFDCGAGPANILCGQGTLGVDLVQLTVAPTVSYKLNERHSIGASLLLTLQRFKAEGLQAFDNAPGFPPFTGAPGSVTNRGTDNSTGVGLRLGWLGRLTDTVSVGASYAPKTHMRPFDKYRGLFAGGGDFDIPSHYGLGVAITPTPALTIAADWMRINYGEVASVGRPSLPVAPLGAPDGPGFGWRDIDVVKLGAEWKLSDAWTLRGGVSHGRNPIRAADVTFNILAPGVMTTHYALGFTRAWSGGHELTGALMVAPRRSVTGASLFDAFLGPGAGGQETIRMREVSFGLAWGRSF